MYKNIILGSSLAFIVALSGCGGAMSEAESLSAAKSAYAKKEYSQASIYLKKILQENSNHSQARYLLGEVYLSLGMWVKSEKEFNKALEFGRDEKDVYPKLAKAYYYLEDLVGLEELVSLELPPLFKQEVDFYIARFHTKMGDLESGKIAFDRVIQEGTETKYSELSRVYLTLIEQKYKEALSQSGALLTKFPLFTDALEFEGFLNFQLKDYSASADSFKKFLAIHVNAHELRLMYASALNKSGDITEAEKQTDFLLKNTPNNPLLNEIKAHVYFSKKDFRNAKLSAEKTLNVQKNRIMASIIAGASAYELNELESAYTYLQPLELYIPASHPSMILLNIIRFELGYTDDAFMSLNNSNDINLSSQMLSASASELLLQGRSNQAESLLNKALSKEPKNSKLLFQKGVANLTKDTALAKELLAKSIEQDPDNQTAIGILVHAYVVDNQFQLAIDLITSVESWHKNYSLQLMGMVLKTKGDLNESAKYFSLLVENNPENFQGHVGLASIALLSDDIELAISHYKKAYRLKSYKALNQLVSISRDKNYIKQIKSIFKELSQLEKEDSFFKVGYAEILLKNGEIGNANVEIDNALQSHGTDKEVLLYKSKILVLAKQYKKALQILDNLLKDNADDFTVLEHKSNLLSLMGEFSAAIEINSRLRKSRPQSIKHLVDLIGNYIGLGNLAKTKSLVLQLTEMPNTSVIANRFNGKILFIEQKYDQAIPQLTAAYKGHQSLDVLVELVQSLQNNNQHQKALAMLLEFENNNEINIVLKFKKAELFQENGNTAEAILEYLDIILLHPQNVAAYNNLAWLYYTEGNFELARGTALKAFKLDETNDYVIHTLGLSQLYSENTKEALAVLQKLSDSVNDSFKVALVEALVANGEVRQAKALFDVLDMRKMDKETLVRYEKIRL
jgi:putative PEP-CTERM system TPR-repeat lipoprotein